MTAAAPKLSSSSAETLRAVAHTKRLLERVTADPEFRRKLHDDPRRTATEYGVEVDAEEIRPLWDGDFAAAHPGYVPSPVVTAYRDFYKWKVEMRDSYRARSAPSDTRFAQWRSRQIARADAQLSAGAGSQIIHAPFCVELARGCSVGCSFCGISAPKLTDIFFHTDENAALWRDVLGVMKDLCGEAASCGFCYWATDPLDNPDYEKFCADFQDVTGSWPATTTALSLKNPERTRALIRMANERDCLVNRFSILTLKMIDRVHQTFTPEELLYTECLGLNPESDLVKANAGRFRDKALNDPSMLEREHKKLEGKVKVLDPEREGTIPLSDAGPETIACVSGYLVNMVDRTVKLISPCPASERWPLGYMIFAESSFTTAAEFRAAVESMVAGQMIESIDEDRVIRFRRDLKYVPTDDGFELTTSFHRVRFTNRAAPEYLHQLGSAIQDGARPAGIIALTTFYSTGVPLESTLSTIDLMFARGVLDEEPQQAGSQAS